MLKTVTKIPLYQQDYATKSTVFFYPRQFTRQSGDRTYYIPSAPSPV